MESEHFELDQKLSSSETEIEKGRSLLELNEYCQSPEFANRLTELTTYFCKYPSANGFLGFWVKQDENDIFFRNATGRIDFHTKPPEFKLHQQENPVAYELINGLLTPSFRRRYARRYGNETIKQEEKEWRQEAKKSQHPDYYYGWFANFPGWWTYNLSYTHEKAFWQGDINNPRIPISIAISHKATQSIINEGRSKGGYPRTRHRVSPREFNGIVLENTSDIYVDKLTGSFLTDGSYAIPKYRDKFEASKNNAYSLPKDRQQDIIVEEARKYGDYVQENSKDHQVLPVFDSLGNLLWPVKIDNGLLISFLDKNLTIQT